jgi:signal transduction histidine kinase
MVDNAKETVVSSEGLNGSSVQEVEIVEYELTTKKATRKQKPSIEDFSMDGLFLDTMSLIEDVNKEKTFKREKKSFEQERERLLEEAGSNPRELPELIQAYSVNFMRNISDELTDLAHQIENQKLIVGRNQEVSNQCFNVRECPDHACVAYQAVNPRCWFVAGETCGCRTHLGIPSCYDCQVFQMATKEPVTKIRETVFYVLGLVRNRTERLRAFEREVKELKDRLHQTQALHKHEHIAGVDENLFEQQLLGELVNITRKGALLDPQQEKEVTEQHKILTEQLGAAYLQLQALTSELERSNKELEDKIADRTEELRKSNVALREAVKKAQEADRLKSEFIANVSHELRTPLNSIIGFSKVLMSGIDGEITDTQRVDLSAIYNSGRHLLEIINSILELSKIEAGKMELHITTFDLVPIVSEIVTASQTLVMGKNVKIESRFDGTIPVIEADVTKIRQIIFNLVSNAAKFTEQGSITIRLRADQARVAVSVVDTGIGIDKDHVDAIFERFRQVDGSTTRKAGGTGLGLSIAKRFVEMHGGDLRVDSKLGKGSVFTMIIPIKHKPPEPKNE